MAKSYIVDHLQQSYINNEELEFIVELCEGHDDLIRSRFQSRHSNRKQYITTIRFNAQNEKPVTGWYCTCSIGSREVGMCSHTTALLWHLGVDRGIIPTTHPLSATKLHTAIDDSMLFSEHEDSSDDDNIDPGGSATFANKKISEDIDW
jgi:hypothetical protein